ncbi:MAG: type II secretion system F family protein [Candidatus Aenigmatarchaeota archaeon]
MDIKRIPPIIAVILVLIGVIGFYGDPGLMGNFILLAVIVGVIPFVLISYFDYQKIKIIEEQLPTFLLDLSETLKTGMSLPDGLKQISKTDYGKLSPEIKKINDQISWGIPLQEAMEKFANRIKKSKLVGRIIRIINEAYSSGGDIARTLESTASDLLVIKEAEKERKAITSQHVLVMYAIFYIFIGIIIGLSKTLLPMLQLNIETAALGGLLAFQDPCTACIGNPHLFCISCGIFGIVSQMFGLGTGATGYYNSLFLIMVVIQGIFSGLVAGQIGEGSVIAGTKHSIIMASSGFAILIILLQTGLI